MAGSRERRQGAEHPHLTPEAYSYASPALVKCGLKDEGHIRYLRARCPDLCIRSIRGMASHLLHFTIKAI